MRSRSSRLLEVSDESLTRPCPVMLERLPNYERSVVQSLQKEVADGPGEANSDSGDSLFITQKDVPEAVRSGRRSHCNIRSDSKLQQHEDLLKLIPDSSSSSDEEPKTARKGKKGCYKVPKFKFSFLNENNKSKPIINNAKNAKFQSCAMASFIISVRELWRSFEFGGDLAASLPTIDKDGEVLSSMSEGGEETSEDEDIKVVERKCFVTSLRETMSQPWNNLDKRQKDKFQAFNESQNEEAKWTDRGSRKKSSKEFLSSATESSDEETVVSKKDEVSDADTLSQIRRQTKKRLIANSSHATACEPSPKKHIRRDLEACIAPAEPNSQDSHMDKQSQSGRAECGLENQNPSSVDVHNDTLCRKSRGKKRKKKKDKEDEEHTQKETEDQHDLVDITEDKCLSQQVDTPVLKWKEKKMREKSAEDEVRKGQHEEQVEDDSVKKWIVSKKTKKKKQESAKEEEVGQEQSEKQLEDDSVEKWAVSKKTKKKKKKSAEEEEVGQGQPEDQLEDDSVEDSKWSISKKKKKKEKSAEKEEAGQGQPEEQVEDDSVEKWAVSKKTKKKKKKSAEEEEAGQGQLEDQLEDDSVEKWSISKKTKKKKEKSAEEEVGQGQPEEQFEDDSVEKWAVSKKTKKKKKKSAEEEEAGQGQPEEQVEDDSVKKWAVSKKTKKKKKKSAEEEEAGQGQPEEQVEDDSVENTKWTVSKKTKRRNYVEENTAAETSSDGSTKKKMKKKKHLYSNVPQTSPGPHEEMGRYLENTDVSQETTESRSTKRKKKKESTSTDDPSIAGDDNDAVTMETDMNLTVKKKKRRSMSVTEDISHTAEENTQKEKERGEVKTKKKEMKECSSAVICEETVAPGDGSVSMQKKKKKKSSFLTADGEEKSRKKHKQQHSPSPSAASPDVCAEVLTAASADATEGYSESKYGRIGLLLQSVWKEKQNLRNWRMYPKRKKKQKRNDSEVMSSTEKLESLADVENSQTEEAVVMKKKKKRKQDAEKTRETVV